MTAVNATFLRISGTVNALTMVATTVPGYSSIS
jgi:hypothetical protein